MLFHFLNFIICHLHALILNLYMQFLPQTLCVLYLTSVPVSVSYSSAI